MHVAAAIEAALPALPIFAGLDGEAARRAAARFELIAAQGGTVLFREGEAADALYVVVAGAVGVSVRDGSGGERRLARVVSGETIGEMALISDATRSATAAALRDTLLLRVTREAFEAFVGDWPPAMRYLSRLLSERLRRASAARPLRRAVRTIALLPASEGVDTLAFGRALGAILRDRLGERLAVIEEQPAPGEEGRLDALESEHAVTLVVAPALPGAWADLCLRRADHVLHLARAGERALPVARAERSLWRRHDLVLIQDAAAVRPKSAGAGLPAMDLRIQVREGARADIARADLERLSRLVLGRAVGVVLSGGGARAFAHVGVLRALSERGIPVDLVAGTSMGAVVGAGAALGWSARELTERIEEAFAATSPLNDWTLPFVALTRGRHVDARLDRCFGSARIEDLWLPFFCVSANLTSGRSVVHDDGPLVRALRASIAIPGLLPPVIAPEGVLVDGALLNNLPADLMADLDRGPVLAISLAQGARLGLRRRALLPRLGRRLFGIAPQMPGIAELLLRSATLSSEAQESKARASATVTLEPPVAEIDLRAWRSFARVVEIGYRAASEAVDAGRLDVLTPREAQDRRPEAAAVRGAHDAGRPTGTSAASDSPAAGASARRADSSRP